MNSELEPSWKVIEAFVDDLLIQRTGSRLSPPERIVAHGTWEDKTYEEMAEDSKYAAGYLNRDVGQKLWEKLSDALREKVSKNNFQEVSKLQWQKGSLVSPPSLPTDLKVPDGPIDLSCPFYIQRSPIETDCYEMVLQPGSLIRIRSPRRMGKTSLFNRILDYASGKEFKAVRVNLRQADRTKFASSNTFLRWFCASVSHQLAQKPELDNYWDDEIGSMLSATLYFEKHLLEPLEQTDSNLVVGLDEIDWIFHYPEIALEFLPLLRSWYEEAKPNPLWKRLRFVIAHATEVYISLADKQSPFNVGLPIQLPEFNQSHVEKLAQLHKLDWMNGETIEKLMRMIGGHPYLVRVAMYNFARQSVTLEQFLQEAPTHAGVYKDHLQSHLRYLPQQPDLLDALRQVVMADGPIQLEWRRVRQLESMGLVKPDGNKVKPTCELYRQYFCAQLAHM
jgi:hypothetical protein